MGEPERMEVLENKLKSLYSDLSIARSLSYYIEIMASRIHKASAVQALAQHYEVDMADTLAFGDNFND